MLFNEWRVKGRDVKHRPDHMKDLPERGTDVAVDTRVPRRLGPVRILVSLAVAVGLMAAQPSVAAADVVSSSPAAQQRSSGAQAQLATIADRQLAQDRKGFKIKYITNRQTTQPYLRGTALAGYNGEGVYWQTLKGRPTVYLNGDDSLEFAFTGRMWADTAPGNFRPIFQTALKNAGLNADSWIPMDRTITDVETWVLNTASPAFQVTRLVESATSVRKRSNGTRDVFLVRNDQGLWRVTTRSGKIQLVVSPFGDRSSYVSRGPASPPFPPVVLASTDLDEQGAVYYSDSRVLLPQVRGLQPRARFNSQQEAVSAIRERMNSVSSRWRVVETRLGAVAYSLTERFAPDFPELWAGLEAKKIRGYWRAVYVSSF